MNDKKKEKSVKENLKKYWLYIIYVLFINWLSLGEWFYFLSDNGGLLEYVDEFSFDGADLTLLINTPAYIINNAAFLFTMIVLFILSMVVVVLFNYFYFKKNTVNIVWVRRIIISLFLLMYLILLIFIKKEWMWTVFLSHFRFFIVAIIVPELMNRMRKSREIKKVKD